MILNKVNDIFILGDNMSKKNKKKDEEKQEINAVNTEVDIENAYYNYYLLQVDYYLV